MRDLPALDATVAAPEGAPGYYREHGHVVVRGLATAEEVAAYRPLIERAAAAHNLERRPLAERETYGRAFLQTHNLWRTDEGVARFVLAPRFGRVAAELMGVSGVRLYHDQSLFKEPGGGRTPWHQDQFYWPFTTGDTITMWMPLVDLSDEVGSMSFAAGSHRIGHVSGESISDRSDREITALIAERGLAVETHGALRAGDATFHSGWTLHSAAPNPSDEMRAVMTVIYVADGTVVAPPANPFQELDRRLWLADTPPGAAVDSELNPRVWPSP
ncbi:MAG TPA: phytanoyl-CoA dioxygenase family protein [Acidimicrobiales bacterium]|nr:phytanoyl-CoA dioxygenase family protein [Acidimicrobiales bacterium]